MQSRAGLRAESVCYSVLQ